MSDHEVGDAVTVWVEFQGGDGQPADPTTVTLVVQAPDGSTLTPVLGNPSVGRYEAVVDVTQAGRWEHLWVGTGSPQKAAQGTFEVRRRRVMA
jgi:hypothetical protein